MLISSFIERMHATTLDNSGPSRPKFPVSRSFTRLDSPSNEQQTRVRANTIQHGETPTIFEHAALSSSPTADKPDRADIFAAKDVEELDSPTGYESTNPNLRTPKSFEEIPIELRSLTERFLESLTTRAHPTPVNIDGLADIFQEFYIKAEQHINTHIATVSSRLSRERSTSSVRSTRSSKTSSPSIGTSQEYEASPQIDQRMLSADEIQDKRRARRLLEVKRTALEEIIERTVCQRTYDKIWRHRSSDDEERDQKLRSKIAALSLIGIGLKELLAGADEIPDQVRAKTVSEQDRIRTLLAPARQSLRDMSAETCPLGKMQQLSATHKAVVETLSQLFPSTSSADEVLPTLIYALMTSSPEHCNVVSDLHFIQRFRATNKVDGEAAYCLVNLEAAISFLETVDLSSLRADELPQGPEKASSRPETPRTERPPMELGIAPVEAPAAASNSQVLKPLPSPTKRSRGLSNLISMQANRIETASDTLRTTVLNGADEALDTVNTALENSFKFLFGRLKEQQAHTSTDVMPKTLADARKLVSTPPPPLGLDEEGSTGSAMDASEDQRSITDGILPRTTSGERMLELVGGKRTIRDHSVDSSRSGNSGKRVSFSMSGSTLRPVHGLGVLAPTSAPSSVDGSTVDATERSLPQTAHTSAGLPVPAVPGAGAIESMRNLGNTLNPLNTLGRIGLFGRTASSGSNTLPTASRNTASVSEPAQMTERPAAPTPTSLSRLVSGTGPAPSKTAAEVRTLTAVTELKSTLQSGPPVKKFVDAKTASDLRIGDVEELLREYQKLVAAVGKVVAG